MDKIVLLGFHVIKGVRLAVKKGLNKEEQIRGGGGWDKSYHGKRAGPSRGHPQGYSSGGGRFGGGGAEIPSNSAYPPANSYSEAGPAGQAPYYGASSSSGGYSGYGGQGQGGFSDYSGYSRFGQTWSSGQGGAAQGGGPGGGPLRGLQRHTRGAKPYDPYASQ